MQRRGLARSELADGNRGAGDAVGAVAGDHGPVGQDGVELEQHRLAGADGARVKPDLVDPPRMLEEHAEPVVDQLLAVAIERLQVVRA